MNHNEMNILWKTVNFSPHKSWNDVLRYNLDCLVTYFLFLVDEDDIDETTDDDEYDDAESQEDDDDDETADSNDPLDNGFGRWEEWASSTTRAPVSTSTPAPVRTTATRVPVLPVVTTPKASETPATQDPYFTHFDPRIEHQSFKDAQQRLEEIHREKVSRSLTIDSSNNRTYSNFMLIGHKGNEGMVRAGGKVPGNARFGPSRGGRFQTTHDRPVPSRRQSSGTGRRCRTEATGGFAPTESPCSHCTATTGRFGLLHPRFSWNSTKRNTDSHYTCIHKICRYHNRLIPIHFRRTAYKSAFRNFCAHFTRTEHTQ